MMKTRTKPPRRGRAIALASLLALAAAGWVLLDLAPSVPEPDRPTARDIAATRSSYEVLREGDPAGVMLDNRALGGLASLVADGSGIERVSARVAGGVLEGRASVPLLPGTWLNLSARVAGEGAGFPQVHCTAGRLDFSPSMCRWAIEQARAMLHRRGGDLPPLDRLVRRVAVGQETVRVVVDPPRNGGLIGRLVSGRRAPIDKLAVRNAYCALVARERAAPAASLDVVLRRAFAGTGTWDESRARTAFVAAAVLTVGEQAERLLLTDADFPGRGCARLVPPLTLHGRADLAQHWALSAGLTAAFGSAAATRMGEWKELEDSLPDGSGFSFVDLAADRAGVGYARKAVEQGDAAEVAVTLRSASQETVLPSRLLTGPEGLSEASFARRYRALDAAKYSAAIEAIDAELANRGR